MKHKVKIVTKCAMFAALLCIFSAVTVPVGAVPFSFSFLGVMLTGIILGIVTAPLSVAIFLLLGLFLPVFSGFQTGMTALPGPTGGYIWSYILMALIIAAFCRIPAQSYFSSVSVAFIGCLAGGAVCYLCGTLQFAACTGKPLSDALAVCVIPFILPDLIKATIASFLGVEIRNLLKKNRLI